MNNLLINISDILYKNKLVKKLSNIRSKKCFPMSVFPPQNGEEPFSILVLVYDENDSRYFDLGYYDFEEKRWRLLNEESMNLKCWCHAPDPSEYLTDNKYPIHSIP